MKTRIAIFVNGSGTTTARCTKHYNHDSWKVELYNLKTKGFQLIDTINIPKRVLHNGWNMFYSAWIIWATHNLGI